jgi:cytochrome c oxidase cbb3-type subunit III
VQGAAAGAGGSTARPAARDSIGAARDAGATPAGVVDEARVAAGAAAYAKYCALCHGVDATGYAADNAPSLQSKTFLATASDTFLRRSIREGRPGTAMAGYAKDLSGPLGDDDIGSIVAFLRSKGPPVISLPTNPIAGSVADGEAIYQGLCARCHGTPGARGTAVHLANAAFLAAASDQFLRHAIMNGRPGTPMVAFGGALLPAEVAGVVAFIRSWAAPPVPRTAPTAEALEGPVIINPNGKSPKFTLREGRYVPVDQVKKALDAHSRLVIIDARATPDWAMSRIPGAISVPYYQFARLDTLPRDNTWILAYCACPHHASGVVVDELRKRGFTRTAVIDEGILEWQRRGYPTAGTQPPLPPPPSAPPSAPPAPAASGAGPRR